VVFSAAHRDPQTGALHGHDYQVTATFPGEPLRRFEVLQVKLRETLHGLEHSELPPELWSAEALAPAIGRLLGDAIKVVVARPWLGHSVTWTP